MFQLQSSFIIQSHWNRERARKRDRERLEIKEWTSKWISDNSCDWFDQHNLCPFIRCIHVYGIIVLVCLILAIRHQRTKQKNNDNVLWNWITFLPWNFGFLSIHYSLTAPFFKKKKIPYKLQQCRNQWRKRAGKQSFIHYIRRVFFLFDFQFFWPKVSAFFNTFKTLISYVSARTYLSSVCLGHKRMVFMYGSEMSMH